MTNFPCKIVIMQPKTQVLHKDLLPVLESWVLFHVKVIS